MRWRLSIGAFISALSVAIFLVSLGILQVHAAEIRSGDQPSIKAEERISEDVYIAGGNISSAGAITADLIAAGGNILVSGAVSGDLIAAAGSVSVLGDVGDDVRVAGGNLLLQSDVRGDAVLAGGQITVGGSVGGDLLVGGGTIRIEAPVQGDVRIGGGDVYLNAPVAGNVEVYAEKLTLGSETKIAGNLNYTAGKEATLEDGAQVAGETTFKKRERTVSVGGVVAIISLALIGTIIAQLVSALFIGLLFRRYAVRTVEVAAAKPLLEVGRGLIFIIVVPVASMILMWSLIGIPLGILGFLLFGTTMMYLWIMTPVILGSFAYRSFFGGEFDVNWKTIVLGVAIYSLLGIIPIVGWLAQFILILLTLGAIVKIKWEIAKEWR